MVYKKRFLISNHPIFKTLSKSLFPFLPWLAIFIATVTLFLPIYYDSNKVLSPAIDVVGQYTPWRYFLIESFSKTKEIPLWNPHFFSGTPFVANPLTAVYFPITWLLLIIVPPKGIDYLFFLDIFLLGMFTYLFAQLTRIGIIASLISSFINMFGAFTVLKIFAGHLSNLDGIVWFTACLYFTESYFLKRSALRLLACVLPFSLLILSGHAQYTFYGFFALSIYALSRSIKLKPKLLINYKRILSFFLIVAFSISITAIQLLPSWAHIDHTNRSGGIDFSTSSSFALTFKSLLLVVLPHFFGDWNAFWAPGSFWEISLYVGVLPLLLVFFMFKKHNTYNLPLLTLLIFSLLFALGKSTPLFKIMYNFVPGFSLFQIPATILFVYTFSIAILAGIGFNNLIIKTPKPANQIKVIFVIFIIFLTILFSSLYYIPENIFTNSVEKYILGESYGIGFNKSILAKTIHNDILHFLANLIISCCAFLVLFETSKKSLIKTMFAGIILVELLNFSMPYIQVEPIDNKYRKIDKNLFNILTNEAGQFRILTNDNIDSFQLTKHGFESITGYDPTYLYNYGKYFSKLGKNKEYSYSQYLSSENIDNINILQELNVQYIISKKMLNLPNIRQIYNREGEYLYKIIETLPRAYSITTDGKILRNVQTIYSSPNRIDLRVNNSKKTTLVLSEIYYPGWKAKINGNDTEISVYKGIFRSIKLQSGKSDITFQFEPQLYLFGKVISAISICVYLFSLSIFLIRKHIRINPQFLVYIYKN